MFGSDILETIIGIIFVFLFVSLICTAIREAIESVLKTRAAFLERGLRELLHDKDAVGIARSFYNHPLVYGLYAGDYVPRVMKTTLSGLTHGGTLPTYIPTRTFALTLMDLAARGPLNAAGTSDATSPVLSLASVRANILHIESAPVQRILLTAIDTAQGDIDRAVANIGAWYDSSMDRVSGGYKRATQKVLFGIGLLVAIALNVNPFTIADYLYRNDSARKAVVARAEAAARDPNFMQRDSTPTHSYAAARAELDSLRLPIGWPDPHFGSHAGATTTTTASTGGVTPVKVDGERAFDWGYFGSLIAGWLVTALAATLGAPFWFDMLNKVMVVRSTVKPHEKSPEESSEDRQSAAGNDVIAKGEVGAGAPAVGARAESAPIHSEPLVQAAAPTAAPIAAAPGPRAASPPDPEADVDGCDVQVAAADHTADEDLPVAHGGVA